MEADKRLRDLLKLLGDESERVRERVWGEIDRHAGAWEAELVRFLPALPQPYRARLGGRLAGLERGRLRALWPAWPSAGDGPRGLEAGLNLLGRILDPDRAPEALPRGLDALADGYRRGHRPLCATSLAAYLFGEGGAGLAGAERDFYSPVNSDLARVLERKRGLPLSLACIFILVGDRLGLAIHGCDVPSHFLARAEEDGKEVVVDCFRGGRTLEPAELEALEAAHPGFLAALRTPATARAMVLRVLRNLANAYTLAGQADMAALAAELGAELPPGG